MILPTERKKDCKKTIKVEPAIDESRKTGSTLFRQIWNHKKQNSWV